MKRLMGKSGSGRNIDQINQAIQSFLEPLEGRRYMSVADNIGLPVLDLDIPGTASTQVVSPTVKQLDIKVTGATGTDGTSTAFTLLPPAVVEIHVLVNNDGTLNGTAPGEDLQIYRDNDNSGGLSAGDTMLLTGEISEFASNNITTEFVFDTTENSGPWSTSTNFFGTLSPNAKDVGVQLDLADPNHDPSLPVPPLDFTACFTNFSPKGILGSLPHQINQPPGELSGFVYDDCAAVASSNNGVFDAGESPIPNVTVQLLDSLNNVIATMTTDANGFYDFPNLLPGTYGIHEIQPSGFLDGKDTVGTLGGNNSTNDTFTNIVVNGGNGQNYNFGELDPASLSGFVYDDLNNNGIFEPPTEEGIPGVTVTLSGSNDLGPIVAVTTTTDANGMYTFPGLRPGTYVLSETQPAGFVDGQDTIGTPGGTTSNDKFSNIILNCDVNGANNNFGEMGLLHGLTGTIGFWRNKNGQQLINDFGAANTSQIGQSLNLGNWLASNFPNIYGCSGTPNYFKGKTTSYIAARFATLFSTTMGQKLDCQVMGLCFSIYATTKELNNGSIGQTFATKHGFTLSAQNSAANLKNQLWNVGNNGEAFATKNSQGKYVSADNQSLSVWTLLTRANGFAVKGVLWANPITIGTTVFTSTALRDEGNVVFSAINQAGDISS